MEGGHIESGLAHGKKSFAGISDIHFHDIYAGGRVRAVCFARVAALRFSGPSLGRVNTSSFVGSRYAPFHLTPKCRGGPVTRPVCPESPSRSPSQACSPPSPLCSTGAYR